MFTELIDTLRCPNAHEDSWLVATSTRTQSRHIMEGRLGCPVCSATFEITDGEVLFASPGALRTTRVLDDEAAFRLAAQLHLVEAPQPILLTGSWSRAVAPLRTLVPNVTMFVGDATSIITLDERVSSLRLPVSGFPLATGALRGIALDAQHISDTFIAASARVLRTGGRLVAPASLTLHDTIWRTLAHDADVVVAERLPTSSAPIQLKRAPSAPLF
ncbi:MAG: hypothetical protein H7099_10470 [Gemmatimonadaceae bacterium]|nr:hypothetical protein [Gemmatimonadaceae bacterium]